MRAGEKGKKRWKFKRERMVSCEGEEMKELGVGRRKKTQVKYYIISTLNTKTWTVSSYSLNGYKNSTYMYICMAFSKSSVPSSKKRFFFLKYFIVFYTNLSRTILPCSVMLNISPRIMRSPTWIEEHYPTTQSLNYHSYPQRRPVDSTGIITL